MIQVGQEVTFFSEIYQENITGIVDAITNEWITVGNWQVKPERVTAINNAEVGEHGLANRLKPCAL